MTGKRLLALVAIATVTMGAQDEPLWKLELRLQLQDDKKCELLYTTNERQMELGGDGTVSGRAHCQDKRAYDFSRLRPTEPFKLAECEIKAC